MTLTKGQIIDLLGNRLDGAQVIYSYRSNIPFYKNYHETLFTFHGKKFIMFSRMGQIFRDNESPVIYEVQAGKCSRSIYEAI